MNTMQLPDAESEEGVLTSNVSTTNKLTSAELDDKIKKTRSLIGALSKLTGENEAMRQRHIGELQIELTTLEEESQRLTSKEITDDERFLIRKPKAETDPIGRLDDLNNFIDKNGPIVLKTDHGLSEGKIQKLENELKAARKERAEITKRLLN